MARSPWSEVKSTTVLFSKPESLRAAITSPKNTEWRTSNQVSKQHLKVHLAAHPTCCLFQHTLHSRRLLCFWSLLPWSGHCSFWWRWSRNPQGAYLQTATTSEQTLDRKKPLRENTICHKILTSCGTDTAITGPWCAYNYNYNETNYTNVILCFCNSVYYCYYLYTIVVFINILNKLLFWKC